MSAGKIYNRLRSIRDDYVERAIECAQLTIPSVFVGDRDTNQTQNSRGELPDPHQSVGARGVRNLASKMMLTLLPSNSPFFNLITDEDLLETLTAEMGIQRGEVELVLNKLSRTIHQFMQKSNLRTESSEILMSLLIDGNPLIYVDPDMRINVYRLDQFVLERDPSGKILQIVLKETFDKRSLPEDILEMLEDKATGSEEKKNAVNVYTHVKLEADGRYVRYQEVEGKKVPDSETRYPKDVLPWIAPRIFKVHGEHYGRSYVEEYLGDLRAFESLSESLTDMAAASSRVLFLVAPNSMTDIDDLNGAENGSYIPGRVGDINPLLANLQGDFGVAQTHAAQIEQRLAQAFLLMSSMQRNAERVTAQEIRLMAEELDNALGGIFSILADEFQMPLVSAFIFRLKNAIDFEMPDEVVPNIVTGLDALGRGQDLNKLNSFMAQVVELSNAGVQVSGFINTTELIKRMAAGNGIDTNGLVKTSEELQQEQMAAQQQAMMQGPVADALKQTVINQADPAKQAQMAKAQQQE